MTPAVWAEVKERPEVTMNSYSQVSRLNTSIVPLPVCFGRIVWQPVQLMDGFNHMRFEQSSSTIRPKLLVHQRR